MNEAVITESVNVNFYNNEVRFENGSIIKKQKSNKADTSSEQLVFDFESLLLRGNISGKIFGSVEYGSVDSGTETDGKTSNKNVLADFWGTDSKNAGELFGESKDITASGNYSQRNSFTADSVSPFTNYRLTEKDFDSFGGAKTRFKNNIAAIKLVYELDKTQIIATKEQQAVLAKYVGWGGLSQAFDVNNSDWVKEYNELKDILTREDYKKAKESILTSFYTPKTVIDGVYEGLKHIGFKSGAVLEPALGTGNFVGLMPQDFNAKFYGVEIDNITGKIAKYLYPQSKIKIQGFEETKFPKVFFDCVLTNVPFGSFRIFDEELPSYTFLIHDFFIFKSLLKLRAGGVAAFITSKGTMDKMSKFERRLFSERAELLGAIRLPNNAFKTNANTEVTTDILFFKKRAEHSSDFNDEWLESVENKDGIQLNQYFINNPHMILGTMKKGKSMYGGEDETYCESDGRDLKTALADAIKFLPANTYEPSKNTKALDTPRLIAEEYPINNYCYGIVNDEIYLRIDDELIPQAMTYSNKLRLNGMIKLRQLVRDLLDLQIKDCSDEILENTQFSLNLHYDDFVKITTKAGQRRCDNFIIEAGNLNNPSWHRPMNVVLDINGICPTIDTCQGGHRQPKILENTRIRKLTPLECFLLMGFDISDYKKCREVGISDTQFYKQSGNSIVVKVLEAIFSKLFKAHNCQFKTSNLSNEYFVKCETITPYRT